MLKEKLTELLNATPEDIVITPDLLGKFAPTVKHSPYSTNIEDIALTLIKNARMGNTKATEVIAKILGELPTKSGTQK